jgi:hypothetical protein
MEIVGDEQLIVAVDDTVYSIEELVDESFPVSGTDSASE